MLSDFCFLKEDPRDGVLKEILVRKIDEEDILILMVLSPMFNGLDVINKWIDPYFHEHRAYIGFVDGKIFGIASLEYKKGVLEISNFVSNYYGHGEELLRCIETKNNHAIEIRVPIAAVHFSEDFKAFSAMGYKICRKTAVPYEMVLCKNLRS